MHSLLMNGCDRDLTNHYGFTAIDKANGEEKIV